MRFLLALLLFALIPTSFAQESTATVTETPTWTPTATWTSTPTWTPTATWTATPTWTPTWTPVVQTVVVVQPPVVITQPPIIITAPPVAPQTTPVPPQTTPVSRASSAPVPTQLTPFYGWQRFQSIHFIAVIGTWGIQNDQTASARQYRASSSRGAIARYPFTGDGVRLAYRAHPQGCVFDVVIDNERVATLNSLAAESSWILSDAFFLTSGYHVFDIRSQAQVGGVCSVEFDYIEVFTGPPMPVVVRVANTAQASTPTQIPAQDVAQVVLISAPPTAMPTPTPIPASVISLTVQIAYDANANDTADIGEGVQGVSVRVVNAGTGELLQSGFTDERGAVRFQVVTQQEIVAHIPLLSRTLNVRPVRGRTTQQLWDVLLPPANQPAVIP